MPYEKADYRKSQQYYDDFFDYVEVCAESEKAHYKSAIQIRNRHLIDRSDFVIFWVECKGGAYQTMKYAIKQEKNFINMADFFKI